jgi:hypothetical protein
LHSLRSSDEARQYVEADVQARVEDLVMTTPIKVTQADRDAAADYLDTCGWDWGACGDVREGLVDHPVVQAFALHRIAAEQNALERAARVAEKRAEDRFAECGIREPDTNATYYEGSWAGSLEELDEEDWAIASAVRNLIQQGDNTPEGEG